MAVIGIMECMKGPRAAAAAAGGMVQTAARATLGVVIISVFGFTFLGCAFFGTEIPLTAVLPDPPPHWREAFGDLRFSLLYPDGSGCFQWIADTAGGSAVPLPCSKQANTPVLAYPWSIGEGQGPKAGELRPAGGVFPADLREGSRGLELVLSWENGAAAEVFRSLWRSGVEADLINGPRLAERMRAAADPWTWDLSLIVQELAAGTFNAYDLDPLPVRDVSIGAGGGEWVLESPFRGPCAAGAGGAIHLPELGYGLHHLYGSTGRIDVFLDERGAAVIRY